MQNSTPPKTSLKAFFFVMQSGVITSAIALIAVHLLNRYTDDFNIMGWYADYVFPIGAFLVGIVAGSGYGIASWLLGVRISRYLLAAVLLVQAISYVSAEYIEYRDVTTQMEERGLVFKSTGRLPSFPEYFDYKARHFTWRSEDPNRPNEPLGGSGYFFVLFGAVGFVLGGLLAPIFLWKAPYCADCERYMSKQVLAVFPGGATSPPAGDVADQVLKEYMRNAPEGTCFGEFIIARLKAAVESQNLQLIHQELDSYGTKKANHKLPHRIVLMLVSCNACKNGYFLPTSVTGKGKQTARRAMQTFAVPPQLRQALLK